MEIKRGDVVRIKARGVVREGVVSSAEFIQGTWGIELRDARHGPVYWKQESDGGTVEVLVVSPELMTLRKAVTLARNEAWESHKRMMELVRREYPEAKVGEVHYGECDDLYGYLSYEITAPACPPCQMFVFTLRGDNPFCQNGCIVLIEDEGKEMDYFLAAEAAKRQQ